MEFAICFIILIARLLYESYLEYKANRYVQERERQRMEQNKRTAGEDAGSRKGGCE